MKEVIPEDIRTLAEMADAAGSKLPVALLPDPPPPPELPDGPPPIDQRILLI